MSHRLRTIAIIVTPAQQGNEGVSQAPVLCINEEYITMSLRPITLLSTTLIALIAGCTDTATKAPDAGATPGAVSTMPAASGPETSLKRGMTPEEVKAIMGDPAETKPMKSAVGKAEIWVYHRTTRGQVRQVQVGTNSTPITTTSSSGQTSVLQTIDEPIFQQQTEIIDETIYLLMFDGRYQQLNRTVHNHFEYR
jgi:hypothetical protein